MQILDTRSWLNVLALAPSAAVESAHLLDNPLFNGTLLCALARLLEPRWRVRVRPRPRSIADARANFEAALDVLRAAPVAGRRVPPEYLWSGEECARVRRAAMRFPGDAIALFAGEQRRSVGSVVALVPGVCRRVNT